jgi:DNA-binding transcriptional ArsR family regulator
VALDKTEERSIIFTNRNVAVNRLATHAQQAQFIKALAHPTRLQILEILARRECCVCHLTAVLGQRQPYVSQHLMLLREHGLVLDRKDGLMVYYRPADRRITQIISLMREVLADAGLEAEVQPVPDGPVQGCTCPRCAGL